MRALRLFLCLLLCVALCVSTACAQGVGNGSGSTSVGNGGWCGAQGNERGANVRGGSTTCIPALPPVWAYADGTDHDNNGTTVAEMNALLYDCEGEGTAYSPTANFTINQCPGGGWPYFSLTMLEPNTSGGSVVNPFVGSYANGSAGGGAGSCPAPWNASAPYKATTGVAFDYTSNSATDVLNFAHGETIGADGKAIFGFAGSDLRLFPNLNSTTLQTIVNDIVQDCAFGNPTVAFDLMKGAMSDNTHGGLQTNHAGLWDGHTSGAYGQDVNCCNGTSPFTSSTGIGTPSTYFNGTQHTQGAYINTNCTSGATPDTTCETATYPGDDDYTLAQKNMFTAINHRDGSAFLFNVNGMYNEYDACEIAASSHVYASTREFAVVTSAENDTLQADTQLRQVVNVAAANDACTGKPFFLLDYINNNQYQTEGAGTSGPGTPARAMVFRVHFEASWLFTDDTHPSNIGSWLVTNCLGGGTCLDPWSETFSANFAVPNGQVEAMFTRPFASDGVSNCAENYYSFVYTGNACASGAMQDQTDTVSATGGTCTAGSEACVARRIFTHFYVWDTGKCASYDRTKWTTCYKDIGPLAVFWNLTGSAVTLSNNFFTNALGSYWAQMNYIIEPYCRPNAGMYGNTAASPLYPADGLDGTATTTNECQASTYYDLINGSQMGGYALSNETSIGTSTGPTLHDQGTLAVAGGTP